MAQVESPSLDAVMYHNELNSRCRVISDFNTPSRPYLDQHDQLTCSARAQARKQLDVSEDSPFRLTSAVANTIEGTSSDTHDSAESVHDVDTDDIKRQLDYIKNRLAELKADQKQMTKVPAEVQEQRSSAPTTRGQKDAPTSDQSNSKHLPGDRYHEMSAHSQPKLRPLTGKSDCPNCSCDRRTSVCDLCIHLTQFNKQQLETNSFDGVKKSAGISTSNIAFKHQRDRDNNNDNGYQHYDDRPIRPARERMRAEVEVVDDRVVPGQVLTISKSLNEKRAKLARAIDDLQVAMERIKKKDARLNEERKVVQLYKDQWKFGPSIGGPGASSRDRLGLTTQRRHYQSRYDANLLRDSKALMGFRHIEPTMKLRNYDKQNTSTRSKHTSQFDISNGLRSKSLESLKPTVKKINLTASPNEISVSAFYNGKSTSEINLARAKQTALEVSTKPLAASSAKTSNQADKADDDSEEDANIEVINVDDAEQSKDVTNDVQQKNSLEPKTSTPEPATVEAEDKVRRMTWIPVFGETEIKTVRRPETRRKLAQVQPVSSTKSMNRQPAQLVPRQTRRPLGPKQQTKSPLPSAQSQAPSPVLSEAKRKLRFASDLLEQERNDSTTKNQLSIRKPILVRSRSAFGMSTPQQQEQLSQTNSNSLRVDNSNTNKTPESSRDQPAVRAKTGQQDEPSVLDSSLEIARLEEMVNTQQRLLSQLADQYTREHLRSTGSPISSPSVCPACQHRGQIKSQATTNNNSGVGQITMHAPASNKSLMNLLRDKLNKTKLRLARKLEEERAKHEQLRQKVDVSLSKQSHLEAENELLKQSLSKCIDTCLKDITSTFESISDTITDSIMASSNQTASSELNRANPNDTTSSSSMSSNPGRAADLVSETRYLKQMKNHIEAIESQRRGIFDELSREKQKSSHLESKLSESDASLKELLNVNQQLESQLERVMDEQESIARSAVTLAGRIEMDSNRDSNTAKAAPIIDPRPANPSLTVLDKSETDVSDIDDTFNSVEMYRRYIQSMTPDVESMRHERSLILADLEDIKKMLSEIDK